MKKLQKPSYKTVETVVLYYPENNGCGNCCSIS